jgi:hypothetical protein
MTRRCAGQTRRRARASRSRPRPASARKYRPRRARSEASVINNTTLACPLWTALPPSLFVEPMAVVGRDLPREASPPSVSNLTGNRPAPGRQRSRAAASRQPANVSRGPGSGPPAVGSRTAGSAISGHSPESGLRVRGSWLADLANRARAALGTRPDARIGFRRCMRRLRSWSNLCPNTLCDIRPRGRVAVATSSWSRTRSGKRSQNSPLR